ncbi:MAG: hypothetical protein AAGA40_07235 [Cyanobacteria bacterium P01_E01_bin.45]
MGIRIIRAAALALAICYVPAIVAAKAPIGWAEGEVNRENATSTEVQFEQLQRELENRGFVVKIEPPALQGAYGMLGSSMRTIWIHPVVFELGIALPVLIHEGVHAAQVCAGNGVVTALQLDIEPPNTTRPFFLRYHSYRRTIEAEAYAVQVQADAYERVVKLLEQHC